MPKHTVYATRTIYYEVPDIEAEDELSAIESLIDWVSDDFKQYKTSGKWDFESQQVGN